MNKTIDKTIEYFCYALSLIFAQVALMPFGLHSWELAYGAFCGIAIRDIVDWFHGTPSNKLKSTTHYGVDYFRIDRDRIEICDKCKGDNQ